MTTLMLQSSTVSVKLIAHTGAEIVVNKYGSVGGTCCVCGTRKTATCAGEKRDEEASVEIGSVEEVTHSLGRSRR